MASCSEGTSDRADGGQAGPTVGTHPPSIDASGATAPVGGFRAAAGNLDGRSAEREAERVDSGEASHDAEDLDVGRRIDPGSVEFGQPFGPNRVRGHGEAPHELTGRIVGRVRRRVEGEGPAQRRHFAALESGQRRPRLGDVGRGPLQQRRFGSGDRRLHHRTIGRRPGPPPVPLLPVAPLHPFPPAISRASATEVALRLSKSRGGEGEGEGRGGGRGGGEEGGRGHLTRMAASNEVTPVAIQDRARCLGVGGCRRAEGRRGVERSDRARRSSPGT